MKKPATETLAHDDGETVAAGGAAPADAATTESPQAVELHPLTTEELEELKSQAAKTGEYWERLVRTTADFDNFRKRAARERQEAVKFAHEALLHRLLPILDNFEMALAASQTASAESLQSLQAGITMIHQQLKSALVEAGLEEINATGLPFDPNWHEAVSQQQTTNVPEGHVVQQLRAGYKLKERLLRPATVVVAQKPAPPPAA